MWRQNLACCVFIYNAEWCGLRHLTLIRFVRFYLNDLRIYSIQELTLFQFHLTICVVKNTWMLRKRNVHLWVPSTLYHCFVYWKFEFQAGRLNVVMFSMFEQKKLLYEPGVEPVIYISQNFHIVIFINILGHRQMVSHTIR